MSRPSIAVLAGEPNDYRLFKQYTVQLGVRLICLYNPYHVQGLSPRTNPLLKLRGWQANPIMVRDPGYLALYYPNYEDAPEIDVEELYMLQRLGGANVLDILRSWLERYVFEAYDQYVARQRAVEAARREQIASWMGNTVPQTNIRVEVTRVCIATPEDVARWCTENNYCDWFHQGGSWWAFRGTDVMPVDITRQVTLASRPPEQAESSRDDVLDVRIDSIDVIQQATARAVQAVRTALLQSF